MPQTEVVGDVFFAFAALKRKRQINHMIPRELFRLSLRFSFARFIRIVQQDDVAEAKPKTFYDILRYLCRLAVETDGGKPCED